VLEEKRFMATKKKEDTDLGELLKELAKNWPIMVPIMLLAGIIGVFVAMWVRPVYQVDALLQIESKNNKPSGMMGSLGALFATSSPAETEMELIKSRQVMGSAVEKMRLDLVAEPLNKLDRLLHKEGRVDLMNFSYNKELLPTDFRDEPWFLEMRDSLGNFNLYDYKDSLVLSGAVGQTYHFEYAGDSAAFGIFKAEVREGQRFAVSKLKRLDAIEQFRSAFDVKESKCCFCSSLNG
jgi:tyrosine-protein kinase Etk/Wzc